MRYFMFTRNVVMNVAIFTYKFINLHHLKYDVQKILKMLFSLFVVVLLNTAGYESVYHFKFTVCGCLM